MRRVNGYASSLLLWRLVNLAVIGELSTTRGSEDLGDGSSKCSLSVIDMT
jgi:hypothetical protein